jgi:putative endonuclease
MPRAGETTVHGALRLRSARLNVRIRGNMMPGIHTVYILLCSDGSYYTGMTSDLSLRIEEHNLGLNNRAYTFRRRPVTLAWSREFPTHDEAFRTEMQIKAWSHAKKRALIAGDLQEIHRIVRKEWEAESLPSREQHQEIGG